MNRKYLAVALAMTVASYGWISISTTYAKDPGKGDSISPIKLHSVDVGQCKPFCVEANFTRSVGHVFLVYANGKKKYQSTYYPRWVKGDEAAPLEGEWFQLRTVRAPFPSQAKGASTCGSDGWGWNLGETIFSSPTGGDSTTTATYSGGGQMVVVTTYSNGGGDQTMQDSGYRPESNAGSTPSCEEMRTEYENSRPTE